MFALITLQCKCCIMYADICTIEHFHVCACVLHMVVLSMKVGELYVCIILCLSGTSGVFVHICAPLPCSFSCVLPLLSAGPT